MGEPSPYQIGMQDAATPVAENIHWFHNSLLLPIITAITVFVLALLLIVIFRYNKSANPVPSHNSHNTMLEVAWTLVPILILVLIAVPSFKLLYKQYSYPKADLVIKAIGNQWFWSYEYPDQGISFDSFMLQDSDRQAMIGRGLEAPRLLAVDNEVVVPVDAVVHVMTTSRDVIHSWTIPSFGSKVDAVPGRLAATWFQATRKGVFYGQCSELCGKDHAFMPIAVRVVDKAVFDAWAAAQKAGDGDKAREIIEQAALADKPRSVAASQ
ncbi:MAG: cytochrome c oxidase subunit II [Hyphomicrobiaceae bacterium]